MARLVCGKSFQNFLIPGTIQQVETVTLLFARFSFFCSQIISIDFFTFS